MGRRNNPVAGLVMAAVFGMILANWMCDNQDRRRMTSQPPPTAPQPPQPRVETVQKLLELPAGTEVRDGVAVAVLLDTSGSMNDDVPGADGQPRPKIEIAQACLLEIVRQCRVFVDGHPDKPLQLGIYEFSVREPQPVCRLVVAMGKPDLALAEPAVRRLHAEGGTPIGEAMIAARQDLKGSLLSHTHMLVISDGESNYGTAPGLVARAMMNLPEEQRSSIYFIAFDVAAKPFEMIREAGGLVLSANSGAELQQAVDYLLTGRILAEQPEVPAAKP